MVWGLSLARGLGVRGGGVPWFDGVGGLSAVGLAFGSVYMAVSRA